MKGVASTLLLGVVFASGAAGCSGTGAPPPPNADAVKAAAPAVHPGTVTFVDLDDGSTHDTPADALPKAIAWAQVDGKSIPVVRVESAWRGDKREIRRYGADGSLLDTTVGG